MFAGSFHTLAVEVFACVLLFAAVHFVIMTQDTSAYNFQRQASAEYMQTGTGIQTHTHMHHGPSTRRHSTLRSMAEATYFSLVTQSTVGYGSIVPVSVAAKCVTALQISTTLLFVVRWTAMRM